MADLTAANRRSDQPRSSDRAVAEFAARRKGVVTIGQLLGLGLSEAGVRRRVARGWLHRLYPGVYAVGHTALSAEGRSLAAVLSCGEAAVLSHRSAATLWGLKPPAGRRIEVTVPGGGRPGPAEVHVHRTRRLTEEDLGERDDIPVTTVARTLVDLAEVLQPRQLKRAVHEAEVLRLLDVDAVWAAAGRVSGRRRLKRLLRLLGDPAPPTRSEFEQRFLELCDRADLPRPLVNSLVSTASGEWEVDFLWRDARLIVETDGAASHHTRQAFERDRRRDADLVAAGYRVIRITWRRMLEAPQEIVALLRRASRCRPSRRTSSPRSRPASSSIL